MKTFILNIEPHDDIVSIRDKMGWAKDSRILIVWPNAENGSSGDLLSTTVPLNRRLDLVLLQRHSQALGSKLALVSEDPDVNYFGPRLGIPVYKSLRKAQNQHWHLPFRFRKYKAKIFNEGLTPDDLLMASRVFPYRPADLRSNSIHLPPLARLLFFAIGVLALLAIAASLAPSAQIGLIPRTVVQDVMIEASTNPQIQEIRLAGQVPSELVTIVVEGRDSQPASGSITLPYQPATGIAVFTNLTDQAVEIPEGTVVRPVGEGSSRYETTQDILALAGPGQTVEVDIRCLTPGKSSNLEVGQLAAIEGLLGTQLSVSNPKPISGGSDRKDPAPTQKDRDLLVNHLQDALRITALKEIQGQLDPEDLLIPSSLELVETLTQNYLPEENSPADQLILSMSLEFQARIVSHSSMQSLVQAVFDANLEPGYLPIQDSLQIEIVDWENLDSNPNSTLQSRPPDQFSWTIHAVRRVQAQINQAEVIQLVLTVPPEQVPTLLKKRFPLEELPVIQLQPKWWLRMPILPFRIKVSNGISSGDLLDRNPVDYEGAG